MRLWVTTFNDPDCFYCRNLSLVTLSAKSAELRYQAHSLLGAERSQPSVAMCPSYFGSYLGSHMFPTPQIALQYSQHPRKRENSIVMSSRSQRPQETLSNLRQACDMCHHAKVKCSDGEPCARCRDNNLHCFHSYARKAGKPKGARTERL